MSLGVKEGRPGRFWSDNAIFQQPITGMAKLTYLALCRHAGSDGTSYPSTALLAEEIGFSQRALHRALKELIDAKIVQVDSGKGNGHHNVYTVMGVTDSHTPSAPESDQGMTVGQTEGSTAVLRKTHKGSKGIVLTDDAFIATLKSNPAYHGIDIDRELGKLEAWLLTPRGQGKLKSRSRIVNWLNRCERPVVTTTPKKEMTNGHPEFPPLPRLPGDTGEQRLDPSRRAFAHRSPADFRPGLGSRDAAPPAG